MKRTKVGAAWMLASFLMLLGGFGAAPASAWTGDPDADHGAGQEQRELQEEEEARERARQAAVEAERAVEAMEEVFAVPGWVERKHAKTLGDGSVTYPQWVYRKYPGTLEVEPVPGWIKKHGEIVDGELTFKPWVYRKWPILHYAETPASGRLTVAKKRLDVTFAFSNPKTDHVVMMDNVEGFLASTENRPGYGVVLDMEQSDVGGDFDGNVSLSVSAEAIDNMAQMDDRTFGQMGHAVEATDVELSIGFGFTVEVKGPNGTEVTVEAEPKISISLDGLWDAIFGSDDDEDDATTPPSDYSFDWDETYAAP